MRYIPNTKSDQEQMLTAIRSDSIDALFDDIPRAKKIKDLSVVPNEPLSEIDLMRLAGDLAKKNLSSNGRPSFLGGGAYSHFIPSTVKHITGRSEFYTSYTPYQPEMSQGMLTSIFEYQSMVCEITGMDAANASMYDGATALAEAASLAVHSTQRKGVLVSRAVTPNYRSVLCTYSNGADWELAEFDSVEGVGSSSLDDLTRKITDDTACVIIAQPNFFGCIEDIEKLSIVAKSKGALLIVSVDPISLGLLKRPGDIGADIVTGEGQPLGLPQSFGGPYLGMFAVKKEYMRLMPGRIVGETVDAKGRIGYVLTLQAREQHIRREKAFSNICSNEALCALAASVYMATMGKAGLREVATQCLQKSNYAKKKLSGIVALKAPTFKEFVIRLKRPFAEINKELLENGIIGGLDLGKYYPEMKDHMLIAVTELINKKDIDKLASKLL